MMIRVSFRMMIKVMIKMVITMDIKMQAVYEVRALPKESLHQLLLPQLKVDTFQSVNSRYS